MKEFYKVLVDYFSASRKASWKKQEVVSKIKDLYINEMEKKDERPKRPRIFGSFYDYPTKSSEESARCLEPGTEGAGSTIPHNKE